MSFRSRIILSILSVAALTIGVIAWGAYERCKAVARIEATIVGSAHLSTDRWIDLPKSIDRKISKGLASLAPDERWPGYCERAWPYLVGSDTLVIYLDSLHGDLAQVLTQFSDLRGIRIVAAKDVDVTSSDWKMICTAIRTLPKLDAIVLQGLTIVDDSVVPLSGHPSIGIVKIDRGRITPKSISTFSSMPSLRELAIEELLRFTPEESKAFKDALPQVIVILN